MCLHLHFLIYFLRHLDKVDIINLSEKEGQDLERLTYLPKVIQSVSCRTQIQTQALLTSQFRLSLSVISNCQRKTYSSCKSHHLSVKLGVFLLQHVCVVIMINNSNKGEKCQLSPNTKISFIQRFYFRIICEEILLSKGVIS